MKFLAWLFPPKPLPGDDGINASMRRLNLPVVDYRAKRAEPVVTAIDRMNAEVDRAVAAAEEQMQNDWMERR